MFKPKQNHSKWYLWLYPYLFMLRHEPKYFFKSMIGRANWAWHYEWEYHLKENETDTPDEDSYKSVNFRK